MIVCVGERVTLFDLIVTGLTTGRDVTDRVRDAVTLAVEGM
jgi:hypothetical protein